MVVQGCCEVPLDFFISRHKVFQDFVIFSLFPLIVCVIMRLFEHFLVITKCSKNRGKNELLYIYREKKITPKKGTLSYKPLFLFLNILIKKSKKLQVSF